MLIRPWTSTDRNSRPGDAEGSPVPTGLLPLIEDLTASRRATPVQANDPLWFSGFQQVDDALAAARQIQIAIQGFRRRNPSVPLAVSIAIDACASAPVSLGPGTVEPPHELASLLRIAKPAQILLTPDALQHVTAGTALPLKPFLGRFGVNEYAWIGDGQLEVLQSEPQLTLVVIQPESLADPASSQSFLPPLESQPSSRTIPSSGTHLGRSTAFSNLALAPRRPSLLRTPRVWAFASAPLLAIVIFVGVVLARSGPHSSNAGVLPLAKTQSQPIQTPAPAPPPLTGNKVTPPAAPPVRGTKPAPPPKKKKPQVSAPADANPSSAAAARTTACTEAGSLVQLNALAEQHRRNGHYQDADREFRLVLACDPSNAEAKAGLDRTQRAEQLHPE